MPSANLFPKVFTDTFSSELVASVNYRCHASLRMFLH